MRRRGGQCNGCCIWFMALLTLGVCAGTSQKIWWYMDAGRCSYVWAPCCTLCITTCRRYVCSGGDWYAMRPMVQDMLPPPVQDMTNATAYLGEPGDGEPDYWSTIVAATVGTFGSICTLVATCGPAVRRPGTSPMTAGILVTVAFICHLVVAICLGVQFFTWREDQWVYNFFRADSKNDGYRKWTGTVADYLNQDRYLYSWGNTVTSAFILCIFSAMNELLFATSVFCAAKEKAWVHGVSWDDTAWDRASAKADPVSA